MLTLCFIFIFFSAGVGRTGTLIALDVLLQQLDKEQAVGVKYFVKKMRFSRPYMVQTEVNTIPKIQYLSSSFGFISEKCMLKSGVCNVAHLSLHHRAN